MRIPRDGQWSQDRFERGAEDLELTPVEQVDEVAPHALDVEGSRRLQAVRPLAVSTA